MMNNWPIKELGEVLDYEQPGKYIVASKNYNNDYKTPVLTAGKTFILGNTNEKENIFPADKLPVIIFDDFTTATQFVDFPFKVKSSAMKILHPKKDKADAKYLFYLMQTIKVNHATHKRFWISEYSKIEIPVPPIEEQRKIVARLEKMLAKIKEAKQLRAEAQEATQNLLSAELHKIFELGISKGWELYNIGDRKIMKMTSGGTPSRGNNDFYGGDIAWLKSGELNDNENILDSGEHITDEAVKKSSTKIFPANTVLLAMYGATAGKLGILKNSAATNQAVAGIVCDEKYLNFKYLFYSLVNIREQIVSNAWGGAQPNLSQTIIQQFKIPVPAIVEQKKIVSRLDALSEKIKKLQEYQNQTQADLVALEKSILHQAFSN